MFIGRLTVLASVFLLVSGSAFADEASKAAKAEQIFQLTNSERAFRQVLDQMRSMQMAQIARQHMTAQNQANAQQRQAQMSKLLEDRLSWEKLKPQYIRIYAETYTEEELDGILAFYQSPAGRAMLEKAPVILSKTMKVGQDAVQDMEPEIERLIHETSQTK
ncbi:MAG: DUF2059 domain-containing protein [Bryobacteraceae bacterium]